MVYSLYSLSNLLLARRLGKNFAGPVGQGVTQLSLITEFQKMLYRAMSIVYRNE